MARGIKQIRHTELVSASQFKVIYLVDEMLKQVQHDVYTC
jgi:hypothetical protein